jgi:hypothetical protein
MRLSFVCFAALAATEAWAQSPDMPDVAKNFPPGKDSNSTVLNITIPPGPYTVQVIEDPSFPNRTIYVPQAVPSNVTIPIVAWENGMCYKYGRMYSVFLTEIASQGYFVIAPGQPYVQASGTTRIWQMESIDWASNWKNAPFTVDKTKIAVAGHSCGGGETAANLALDTNHRLTTGLIMNSGSAQPDNLVKITAPILWVNGGAPDNEARSESNYNLIVKTNPTVPIFKAVLDTGHLGSYWSPRGGIYAETAVRWLDWHLKGKAEAKKWFVGGDKSPGALRGWRVASNAIN